ncbi:MAG: ribosome biogenesis GTPase YlqF [Lachnospiraceae bacterium]|nr:ribosome biogenesis GTPase YlqF [Lachnospiraceae bacterium]
MNYEWYPGHMTAAVRMMRENLTLIDLVIELVDARIPSASRNPDIDELCRGKARVLVLNKSDLSDAEGLRRWETVYRNQGLIPVTISARSKDAKKKLLAAVDEAAKPRRERNLRRGIKNQPIRALVCGIPNVGKSTLINLLAGKSVAKTGNKPGVTKGKQWIQTDKSLQLLDSPGILWPRIGDAEVGELLAIIGSMNDEKLESTQLAAGLIRRLYALAPAALLERYSIPPDQAGTDPYMILEHIAERRGLLGEGARTIPERAAEVLLDDFRKGRLGGILLEQPGTEKQAEEQVERSID